MMVLWEENNINVKNLGEKLFLDSGTLTPLLKKLESKGYIERTRLTTDGRNLILSITEKGKKLKEKAKNIPIEVGKCLNIEKEEAIILYQILYKILRKK
jgi:DNA-binding MarR family transcriptional regulator